MSWRHSFARWHGPSWFGAVVVGLAVRAGWLIATVHPPRAEPELGDPFVYLAMADNAYRGDLFTGYLGEPTSFVSVGYPVILAGVRLLSFDLLSSWGAALVVNLLASAALIVGAGRLATIVALRTGSSAETAGLAAGFGAWMMALYPDAIAATGVVMTELAAVAFLIWAIVIAFATVDRVASSTMVVVGGLLLGSAVVIRPSWTLILALGPVLLATKLRELRRPALFAVAAGIIVAPVLWNNTVRVDAGLGLTSAAWVNICDGADRLDGSFGLRDECRQPYEFLPPPDWEANNVRISRSQAISDIGNSPLRWFAAMPVRIVRSFDLGGWGVAVSQDWSQHMGRSVAASAAFRISQLGFVLVATAGAAGLVAALRRERTLRWLVAMMTVGTLLGAAVSFGQARFGWPITAVLFIPFGAYRIASARVRDDRPAVST